MATIVLVPGLWLTAAAWVQVVPTLEEAGHRVVPLTLPGMSSVDEDRSGVSTQDLIDAVVAQVDAAPEQDPVVLVGHSIGARLVHAAVDARAARVVRAVYVGGFPSESGAPLAGGFETSGADLPMPDLASFDEADVADLDAADRVAFAAAIPSPAALATDTVTLLDDRRYQVPVTMICPEFSALDLQAWVAAGDLPEVARLRDVTYVDIDSGHWPQLTRPAELAALIGEAARA